MGSGKAKKVKKPKEGSMWVRDWAEGGQRKLKSPGKRGNSSEIGQRSEMRVDSAHSGRYSKKIQYK